MQIIIYSVQTSIDYDWERPTMILKHIASQAFRQSSISPVKHFASQAFRQQSTLPIKRVAPAPPYHAHQSIDNVALGTYRSASHDSRQGNAALLHVGRRREPDFPPR